MMKSHGKVAMIPRLSKMTTQTAVRSTTPTSGSGVPMASFARQRNITVARMILLPIGAIVGLLVLWEIWVRLANVPRYVLPAPSEVAATIGTRGELLWSNLGVTVSEVLLGFFWGIVVAIPIALVLALVPPVRDALYPLMVLLQVTPKIAVAPLFVVWFGIGSTSVTLLTFLLCFFPMLINSMTGFMNLDPRMLYITRAMGATRLQTFRYLRLQSAMPYIFSGLRISAVFATTGAIVGEFVGSTAGLGFMLAAASGLSNTAEVFAVLFVLAGVGLSLNYAVVLLEWILMPWNRQRADAH